RWHRTRRRSTKHGARGDGDNGGGSGEDGANGITNGETEERRLNGGSPVRRASRSDAARTGRIAKASTLDRGVFVFAIRSGRARRAAKQPDPSNSPSSAPFVSAAPFLCVIPFAPYSPFPLSLSPLLPFPP